MSTPSAQVLGGRYRLDAVLRRGGVATVWSGTDLRLDRPVAVKVLGSLANEDPVMLRRLDQEARTLARLAHPNIVSVYDLGTEAGMPYVVMELVDGDDLRHRLAYGELPLPEVVGITTQVCAALQAAHDAGLVHRDIKPENVLLTGSNLVKVCDFGIARLQRQARTRATEHGTTIGTALYMAPEQARGEPVQARTDLYALGCVLHEMLVGQPPFTGDDPMRVMWQHIHDNPVSVASRRADVPATLDALVTQLLAKDPDHRPASAAEVRVRLENLHEAATGFAMAAADGSSMMRGRAPVVTRTQLMPTVEGDSDERRADRFRLGPGGVIGVALGAALVTALVIAVTMALTGPVPRAGPLPGAIGSATSSAPTVPTAPSPSIATLGDVRDVIAAQVRAGQLESKAANDLFKTLNEIDRNLARGRMGKAAEGVDKLREKLADFAEDDKITNVGHAAVLSSLNTFARSLRVNDNDRDDD